MNEESPKRFGFEAMGTQWQVTLWDPIDDEAFRGVGTEAFRSAKEYESVYSRFLPESLIRTLEHQTGTKEVPADLVKMLRICSALNEASGGSFNPLIGGTLVDLGYDESYSLKPKDTVRKPPDFQKTVSIIDDTHINLKAEALIDLGALGKGYFVDLVAKSFEEKGFKHYLINGSGDIRCKCDGTPLRAGLEHPDDSTKVIGVVEMNEGALCASSVNRRKWADTHHEIDARTGKAAEGILATWVLCPNAALADALATCLFFTKPEFLLEVCDFEFLILSEEFEAKRSPGFAAELF